MKLLPIALLIGCVCYAQQLSPAEQSALTKELGEAGSSPVELIRAIENHLAKFPMSPKRPELERVLVRGAMETKDDARLILYGERVLEREQDDPATLERVARALLATDDKERAERALKYARRYEQLIAELAKSHSDPRTGPAQWHDEVNRGMARALSLQARATGNLGRMDEAVVLAKKAYAAYPSAEAARETGRWLARTWHEEEAVLYYADAFVLAEVSAERAADRKHMGELYRKIKGSETGLGDLILAAYDRTTARAAERKADIEKLDPNTKAKNVLDFTLTAVDGGKLQLASLRGKAIVFDFWATWCGPCRVQHPLYDKVKEKYRSNPDVVFLSVDADENRALVPQFLDEQKWSRAVYYEDGLVTNLAINSIPTTMVVNRRGEIVSRMNGFVPERFVEMLSDRIEEALQ